MTINLCTAIDHIAQGYFTNPLYTYSTTFHQFRIIVTNVTNSILSNWHTSIKIDPQKRKENNYSTQSKGNGGGHFSLEEYNGVDEKQFVC